MPIRFKFTKLGVNYIDGFLKDEILLLVEKGSTKIRIILKDARITFKVFVIDSTKIVEELLPKSIEKIDVKYL